MTKEVTKVLVACWYRCATCELSVQVPTDDSNLKLLKKVMRCPSFQCKGSLRKKTARNFGDLEGAKFTSAIELFQASRGIGLPNEHTCSSKEVKRLLVGAKVKSVQVADSNKPDRALLFSITLDSGKTIHLATSTLGPAVYKITEVEHGR